MAKKKPSWYWLSFADRGAPRGKQFIGVVIVEAPSLNEAYPKALELGIVPGRYLKLAYGKHDCQVWRVDISTIPERCRNRVLTASELEEFGDQVLIRG